MSLSAPLLVVALASAAPPPAAAPTEVYKLRHVAAADAAAAVNTYAWRKKLDVAATADPVSNTVRLAGGELGRGADLLVALDLRPQQVTCQLLYVRVPAGFVEAVGLGELHEGVWTLTAREARMLAAAVGRSKEAAVVSRPRLTLVDNQTGFFQVGDDAGELLAARVTPRLAPGQRGVLVRLDTQTSVPTLVGPPAARDIQSVQTTALVPAGGTLVARGPRCRTAGGEGGELLVLATLTPATMADGERP